MILHDFASNASSLRMLDKKDESTRMFRVVKSLQLSAIEYRCYRTTNRKTRVFRLKFHRTSYLYILLPMLGLSWRALRDVDLDSVSESLSLLLVDDLLPL